MNTPNKSKNRRACLFALLATVWSQMLLADCDFDDFPTMSGMRLFPIMDNATHNNRPMMVKGFSSDSAMEQVVEYYHKKWEDRYSDSLFAQWYQVSTLSDECLMTVQVARSNNSSQGRLIISNVPKVNTEIPVGEGLIKPSDAVVVSDLVTKDGPKNGRVSMLAVGESPDEIAEFYLSQMTRRDWQLQQDFQQGEARVLVFRQGLNLSNVLIVPANDMTQVLINTEEVD